MVQHDLVLCIRHCMLAPMNPATVLKAIEECTVPAISAIIDKGSLQPYVSLVEEKLGKLLKVVHSGSAFWYAVMSDNKETSSLSNLLRIDNVDLLLLLKTIRWVRSATPKKSSASSSAS